MLTEALLRHPVESTYGILGSWYGTRLGDRLLELMLIDSPIDNTEQILKSCLNNILERHKERTPELTDLERLRLFATDKKRGWLERKQQDQQEQHVQQEQKTKH